MKVTVTGLVTDVLEIDLPQNIREHEVEGYVEWVITNGYNGKYIDSHYELQDIKIG